jgi:DNA primase
MAGDMMKALARYGVQVPAAKKMFHVCCPVHQEKTPSCHVDLEKQEWHCFGCGQGGDAAELVLIREYGGDKKRYPEALRLLGIDDQAAGTGQYSARYTPRNTARSTTEKQTAGLVDQVKPAGAAVDPKQDEEDRKAIAAARDIYVNGCISLQHTPGAWYCEARGIPDLLAAAAGAKFSMDFMHGGPAVVSPVLGQDDQLTAVQGRYLLRAPAGKSRPDKNTRGRLQGVFSTIEGLTQPVVIVTEAPIDALSLAACGFPALALLGTRFPEWLPGAIGTRRAYLATDNDNAGEGAAQKLCDALAANGGKVFRLKPEESKDWNEYLCKHGPAAMELALIEAAFPHRQPFPYHPPAWQERMDQARAKLETALQSMAHFL